MNILQIAEFEQRINGDEKLIDFNYHPFVPMLYFELDRRHKFENLSKIYKRMTLVVSLLRSCKIQVFELRIDSNGDAMLHLGYSSELALTFREVVRLLRNGMCRGINRVAIKSGKESKKHFVNTPTFEMFIGCSYKNQKATSKKKIEDKHWEWTQNIEFGKEDVTGFELFSTKACKPICTWKIGK